MLSSNTKKGEIERAFPSLSKFWVFVDNTSDPNRVLSVSKIMRMIKHMTVIDPSKVKRPKRR